MMNEQDINFCGLGIAPQFIEIIEGLKFKTPTPIQHKAIPIALEGQDLIGIAQTGTGKTMAFAIPMIQRLCNEKGEGLVLVPTRELASQVKESFDKIAKKMKIRTAMLIGGEPLKAQLKQISYGPRIIIATPGRLIDLMEQRKIRLTAVRILVLDEADRMLDMGFAPQIEKILKVIPKFRQTMLFSATIPKQIVQLASRHMHFPLQVEIAPSGTSAENVTHELFIVQREHKMDLLTKLLSQSRGSVLLFCRTKIGVTRIARRLRSKGFSVTEIHSNRSQSQRKTSLEGFKSGKFRVLAATDIAARGLDIVGLEFVINYDLPDDTENYVHRIGRTGRAGKSGHAISFASPDQRSNVVGIEKLINDTLPRAQHPEVPSVEFSKPKKIAFYNRSRVRRPYRRRR